MENTTTLLVIDPKTPDSVIVDIAEGAAEKRSHLSCVMLSQAPVMPMYAYGATPYGGIDIPEDWTETLQTAVEELSDREAQLEKVLSRSGVSADIQAVLCATMDMKKVIANRARVCDIAYISPNIRKKPLSDVSTRWTDLSI